MKYVVPVLAALLAAGCGSSRPEPPGPPKLGRPGPPPAWVETKLGSHWLGYSSYCWETVCADYIAPSCRADRHTPVVRVRKGEPLRFHLGFDPKEVGLNVFDDSGRAGQALKLARSRTPVWHPDRPGVISIFARGGGGDASYVACLRFTRAT